MRRCKYCQEWIEWIQPAQGRPVPVEPRPVVVRPDRGTEEFITDKGEWIRGERTLAGPAGGNLVAFVPHRRYCTSKRCRGRWT